MRSVELARPAGTPLSVEVTTAGGRRPVVLLCGAPRELAARLARAGFAAVAFEGREASDLGLVLDGLKRGALSVEGNARVAILAADEAHRKVAADRGIPWSVAPVGTDERSVETIVQWLARHLV